MQDAPVSLTFDVTSRLRAIPGTASVSTEDTADADTAAQSRVPVRAAAEVTTPGFVEHYTGSVDIPVFLAFGAATDVSPNPHAEPANYTSSADVTLHLVPKSGHCHNFSTHRAQLGDRIGVWVRTVISGSIE
jgi:pimeloyl-ACP methyl ester carboxylesterase